MHKLGELRLRRARRFRRENSKPVGSVIESGKGGTCINGLPKDQRPSNVLLQILVNVSLRCVFRDRASSESIPHTHSLFFFVLLQPLHSFSEDRFYCISPAFVQISWSVRPLWQRSISGSPVLWTAYAFTFFRSNCEIKALDMSQKRHSKRFSREGFQPLTRNSSGEMANPNDVTIDIPLTKVSSKTTGARKLGISPTITRKTNEFPDYTDEKQVNARLYPGQAGKRKKLGAKGTGNKNNEDGTLTGAGKLYDKIFHFSVITRYILYVAPLAICFAVPIVIGSAFAPNARIGGVKINWFFTWVEVVWVSLWVSKLVSQLLPYVFQFLCGAVSPGTRKYASVLMALEIPLSLVGWAATSLPTFVVIMTQNPDAREKNATSLKPWESVVKNILFAALFSTIVFLAEKFLIQLISISYHRKQFDEKIRDSKRNIYIVGLLYDASRAMFPSYCQEFAEEDYAMSDFLDLASGKNSRQGHTRSSSATPMKIVHNIGRVKDNVTSAFGNVAQEITGKQVFNPNAAHSIVVEALEKKHTTEALAKRIWLSFVLEGRDALYFDDVTDVLGSDRLAEAEEAFYCLDADGNGDISLEEMILRLGELGRDRHSIAHSMSDVENAISVLDNLLLTVVLLAVVFIFVAWLNHNFTTTLATTGTALLSLSFVFAATAQEVLGSCIFLFVKHPYDVGDRVDVGDNHYVVEKISLLYTIFRRVVDNKKSQVPHIVLNSLWIDNVSRSKAMREQVSIFVNFDTTLEDIELLKAEMTSFVQAKDNARDFQQDIDVEVVGLAEMNKMELKIEIRHKSNWANEAIRATRRSKFMCALVLALRKVPIFAPGGGGAVAGSKANPNYAVTISDVEAKGNAKDFDDAKDEKRLVPLNKINSNNDVGKSTSTDWPSKTPNVETKETTALEGLNKRNILSDPARDSSERDENSLERQRSNDIEEVRGILRRESTTGRRRKAMKNTTLSPQTAAMRLGSQTLPTIPTASPAEPITAPREQPRVSYFEDSNYKPAPLVQAKETPYDQFPQPPVQVPGGMAAQPPRADSATIPSSQAPNFSSNNPYFETGSPPQQVHELRGRARSNTPNGSRKPVPGIPQMSDYLKSPR